MDEEYAMHYAPVIYNWWKQATPAQRQATDAVIKKMRDKFRAGHSIRNIIVWARAQPNGHIHPWGRTRDLVRLATMSPHVPNAREGLRPKRAY